MPHLDSGVRSSATPFDQLLRQRQTSLDELAGNQSGAGDWLVQQRTEAFGQSAQPYRAYAKGTDSAILHPVAIVDRPPLYERPVITPVLSTPPLSNEAGTAAVTSPSTITRIGTTESPVIADAGKTGRATRLDLTSDNRQNKPDKPGSLDKSGKSDVPGTFDSSARAPLAPLNFAYFGQLPETSKFLTPETRVEQSFAPDGSTNITYTARDFTSVKLSRGEDGTSTLVLKDSRGRPQMQEAVSPSGERTLTRMSYHDADGRFSPWLKSKEITAANGTRTTLNYDKLGKVLA